MHKLASSLKIGKQGITAGNSLEHSENSFEHLIIHLLETERIQHMTIQKERPRQQTTFCTSVVTEQPKAILKMRRPKLFDALSL